MELWYSKLCVPNFPKMISTRTKKVGSFPTNEIMNYLITINLFGRIKEIYNILLMPPHFNIATIMVTLR